jgi:tRNA(fMet)-specific endonuclease VapC
VIYLFDTDHISLVQRGSGAAYTTLVSHIAQHSPTDIAFSIISMHEQVLGCHTYINRARSSRDVVEGYEMLEQVLQDFSTVPVLPFDAAAAAVFEDLASQRLRIGRMDLRIASIALSRDMVVVTRNARDFGQVPDLQIEDWTR